VFGQNYKKTTKGEALVREESIKDKVVHNSVENVYKGHFRNVLYPHKCPLSTDLYTVSAEYVSYETF